MGRSLTWGFLPTILETEVHTLYVRIAAEIFGLDEVSEDTWVRMNTLDTQSCVCLSSLSWQFLWFVSSEIQ